LKDKVSKNQLKKAILEAGLSFYDIICIFASAFGYNIAKSVHII